MPTSPLVEALARARAEWIAGQPGAWSRYTAALARLRAAEAVRREPGRPAIEARLVGPFGTAKRPLPH